MSSQTIPSKYILCPDDICYFIDKSGNNKIINIKQHNNYNKNNFIIIALNLYMIYLSYHDMIKLIISSIIFALTIPFIIYDIKNTKNIQKISHMNDNINIMIQQMLVYLSDEIKNPLYALQSLNDDYISDLSIKSLNTIIDDVSSIELLNKKELQINLMYVNFLNFISLIKITYNRTKDIHDVNFRIGITHTENVYICIDTERVTQCISNICSYLFKNGTKFIKMKFGINNTNYISQRFLPGLDSDECYFNIIIDADGNGIHDDKFCSIFQNINLLLTKHICKAMGAILKIDSIYQHGTKFTIAVPVKKNYDISLSNSNNMRIKSPPVVYSRLNPDIHFDNIKNDKTVLIIDKNISNMKIMKVFLYKTYNVIMNQYFNPDVCNDVNVILMEYDPVIAKKIKKQFPHIPIIAISTKYTLVDKIKYFNSVIVKPIKQKKLLSHIKSCI